MTTSSERGMAPADWPAILAVFAMVIAFTYTDDLVELILAVTGIGIDTGQLMVAGLDLLLVAATAGLKWRVAARRDGGGQLSLRSFLSQLLRSWWSVGATLVVVLHMFVIGLSDNLGQGGRLWTSVPVSLLFVVAMSLVLVSTLDSGSTFGAGAWSRNGWILPLIIGTFVGQIASALWYPAILRGRFMRQPDLHRLLRPDGPGHPNAADHTRHRAEFRQAGRVGPQSRRTGRADPHGGNALCC